MAGRPRKAEPEVALDAAMKAFWAKGYEGTSMADLTEATGLHKASLYQTFGDKHALFVSALKRYIQVTSAAHKECQAKAADPVQAIHQTILTTIEMCAVERGCLVVNSLIEVAPYDVEVGKLLKQFSQRLEKNLAGLIREGMDQKLVAGHVEPREVARMLAIFMFGLTTSMAAGMSLNNAGKLLAEQIRIALPPRKKH